ncbi:DUF3168 domain-containing protein [Shouchella lonarensis]|uniref:Uncharacterized protein n=1 Tax=Shouchella lonarensis TaxID=1464122 RepID=A0A1G6HSB7_9BACI|nr:DUF3168 domain-containing protein [Shouchella lonarensis]SDB96386.1 Protein of unknown function [Shouchella lonarensis]
MKKTSGQALYDAVYKASLRLGYNTYDVAPPDASYPFVYIGEQFNQDGQTKSGVYGTVQQTIHVYGLYKDRRLIADMGERLKRACAQISNSDGYYFMYRNASGQMVKDDTTSDILWHNILELEFRYN